MNPHLAATRCLTIVLGLSLLADGSLYGQTPLSLNAPQISSPSPSASISPTQARSSIQWLAGQMMRHVPLTITGDDDWGDTKEIWAGVKVRREGWKLKTNRRKKELRHGRWVRYEIQLPPLVQPDSTGRIVTDQIQIQSVTPVRGDPRIEHQSIDINAWRIAADAKTPAKFTIRVERWNFGLKLYSVEIIGNMKVSMKVASTLAMQPDFSEVPPAMQLLVNVEDASLSIDRFEVERISKLGGDVAEELGDLAENTIGKVWVRKENARLAERLNKSLQKNRDDLRWSMADWLGQLGWNQPKPDKPTTP